MGTWFQVFVSAPNAVQDATEHRRKQVSLCHQGFAADAVRSNGQLVQALVKLTRCLDAKTRSLARSICYAAKIRQAAGPSTDSQVQGFSIAGEADLTGHHALPSTVAESLTMELDGKLAEIAQLEAMVSSLRLHVPVPVVLSTKRCISVTLQSACLMLVLRS